MPVIVLRNEQMCFYSQNHGAEVRNKNLKASLVSHFVEAGHGLDDFKCFVFYKFWPHPFNRVDVFKTLAKFCDPFWVEFISGLVCVFCK